MYHIVYLTTNLINQKIYVGVHSTYNLNDGYLGSGKILQRSINKYGMENFKIQILYYCLSDKDAYEIERQIVDLPFTLKTNTYNIAIGGIGGRREIVSSRLGKTFEEIFGVKKSQEIKEKISRIGTKHTPESLIKISMASKNKKHSKESKLKMSAIKKGYKFSDTAKLNMSNAKSLENNPNAKRWIITNPNGEVFDFVGNIVKFLSDMNLCIKTVRKFYNKGKIETHKKLKGWEFICTPNLSKSNE